MKLGLACGLALSMAGCDEGPSDDAALGPAGDLEFRPGGGGGGGWGCRECNVGNTAHGGLFGIAEFAADPNQIQVPTPKLAGIEDPAGTRYPARVEADQFIAQTPAGDVMGGGLLGWTVVFSNGTFEQPIEITAFEFHPDWVLEDPIPTYGLAYMNLSLPEPELVNVCPDFIADETAVTLIMDERHDDTTNTVLPGEYGWAMMACQGHALAKMKFLGYDPNDAYGSLPEDRQATLRMITADYCGTGQSFTIVGQKLQWIDALGHFLEQDLPYLGAVEARWTDAGADCLDTPRYETRTNVEAVCNIPTCDGDPDIGGAPWVTLLP